MAKYIASPHFSCAFSSPHVLITGPYPRSRQIVLRIADTFHVAGSCARKDKTGHTINTADVLYVVVKQEDGEWKIFARSGNRHLR